MATRYWVGGSGTWNGASTANWSATSGGSSGASVPTSSDDVIFDANSASGTFTVTLGTDVPCRGFDATALDDNMTLALGNSTLTMYGSVYFSATRLALTVTGPFGRLNFTPSTASAFDPRGAAITANVIFGSGASLTLLSNMVMQNTPSVGVTPDIRAVSGSNLSINGQTITGYTFSGPQLGSAAINMGSGATFNLSSTSTTPFYLNAANVTVTGSYTLNLNLLVPIEYYIYAQGGNSTISITGSSTFAWFYGGDVYGFTANINGSLIVSSGTVMYSNVTVQSTGGTLSGTLAASGILNLTGIRLGSLTVTGNWTLASSVVGSFGDVTLQSGSFDAAGYDVSLTSFTTPGTTPRTLNMGSGTWYINTQSSPATNTFDLSTNTNLTAITSNARVVCGSKSVFKGGGYAYKSLTISGASANATIYGSNSFETFTSTATGGYTITFESGTTNTFGLFTATGTSGNTMTLRSTTAGAAATLSKDNGNINIDYANIQDSTTSGTSLWYAGANSVNSGNNTGWIFGAGSSGSMLALIGA